MNARHGNTDVGKGMECTKGAVPYYLDEETMLSFANPGFTT